MTQSDKELLAEIAKLRDDLKQLREIVNVLVNVVMEEEEEEEQEFQPFSSNGGRLNLYN